MNIKAIKTDREELQACIRKVREGDQAAFQALLEVYTPLILAQVSRFATDLGEQDREDLRQEASYALYRSALSYDLDQSEVEFGLYAKICISNTLSTQLRSINRRPRITQAEDAWAQDEGAEDPAAFVLAREEMDALMAKVRALLSPYENRVWGLYLTDYSVTEIARKLGKDPHSVENAVYRIRQKLHRAFGGEDTH
jgi:RNA polymerase sporulation-specific sigma factor